MIPPVWKAQHGGGFRSLDTIFLRQESAAKLHSHAQNLKVVAAYKGSPGTLPEGFEPEVHRLLPRHRHSGNSAAVRKEVAIFSEAYPRPTFHPIARIGRENRDHALRGLSQATAGWRPRCK